ncbi:MAG: hypothetical protein E6R04_03140 [Spirochaetes bacterium]|nr:MAG: hypothetical protein E6R04_03140 [Spirochaetota bacterium]
MDLKVIIDTARRQGWAVRKSRRRNHWKFVSPDTSVPPVHTASTPGDRRAVRNILAILRRHGLNI